MDNKKIGRKIIALLTAIICVFSLCAFSPITTDEEVLEVLEKKSEKVDFNHPYQELESLDKVFADYEVFLTGEAHAMDMNFKMEEYLIPYFVEEQGVKYILLEASFSEGELLNEYLKTGDDGLLGGIVDASKGSLAYNQGSYDSYKSIYKYNKTLPKDKKIRFVGIDVEHQKTVSAQYLKTLLGDGKPSKNIESVVKKMKQAEKYVSDQSFYNEIAKSLEKYKADYKKYFGRNFFSFSLLSKNLLASTSNMAKREKAITSNFTTLYRHLPKGKYYGQFGSTHLIKGKIQFDPNAPSVDTFVNSINRSHKVLKDKFFCMPYFYNNCKMRHINGKIQTVDNLHSDPFVGREATAHFFNKNKVPELYDYLVRNSGYTEKDMGDSFFLISNSKPAAKRVK